MYATNKTNVSFFTQAKFAAFQEWMTGPCYLVTSITSFVIDEPV